MSRLSTLAAGALALAFVSIASARPASLDEASARTILNAAPDRVLAAIVQVETVCDSNAEVCLVGGRVKEVLVTKGPAGTKVLTGDFVNVNVGAGPDPGIPRTGDTMMFLGEPSVEKDGTTSFFAKAMAVSPSPKAVDELRAVIREPVKKAAD